MFFHELSIALLFINFDELMAAHKVRTALRVWQHCQLVVLAEVFTAAHGP